MSKILDYYNEILFTEEETEKMSKTFINFYIFFQKLKRETIISKNALYFLDCALDFSEPLTEGSPSTNKYLDTKLFQLEQFIGLIKDTFPKFEKKFKKTFSLPANYTFDQIKELIEKSYIFYAIVRYKKNIENTRVLDSEFSIEEQMYKLPDDIPEENANISELIEIVSGIKRMTLDGRALDWFNVFGPELHLRALVDITDGQIGALFINGTKHTKVDNALIKKVKNLVKKSVAEQNSKSIPANFKK